MVSRSPGSPLSHVYDSATAYLRDTTRDRGRFPLVFQAMYDYGFRRNLWGLKPWGLTFALTGLGANGGAAAAYYCLNVDASLTTTLIAAGNNNARQWSSARAGRLGDPCP